MTREPGIITAVQIAKANGIDPKVFRGRLRKAEIKWHQHGAPWGVLRGSPQHADMERVMAELMSDLGAVPEP
jgi:hypothetical protein